MPAPAAPAAVCESVRPPDCTQAWCSTTYGTEHFRHIPTAEAVTDPATPTWWVHALPVLDLATFTAMCARADVGAAQRERLLTLALDTTWLRLPDGEHRSARLALLTAALALPTEPAHLLTLASVPARHPDAATGLLTHRLTPQDTPAGEQLALAVLTRHVRSVDLYDREPLVADRHEKELSKAWRRAVRRAHPAGDLVLTLAREVYGNEQALLALVTQVRAAGAEQVLALWQVLLHDAGRAGGRVLPTQRLALLRSACLLTTA